MPPYAPELCPSASPVTVGCEGCENRERCEEGVMDTVPLVRVVGLDVELELAPLLLPVEVGSGVDVTPV